MTYRSKKSGDSSPDLLLADLQDSIVEFILAHEEASKIGHGNNTVAKAENELLFETCMILWKQPVLLVDKEKLMKVEELTEWAFVRSKQFNNEKFQLWNYRK